LYVFFFFNDTATTEIYTLSLHDALPIWGRGRGGVGAVAVPDPPDVPAPGSDRKSTRLNSSHRCISYAVFCLKKTDKRELTVYVSDLVSIAVTSRTYRVGG